MLSFPTRGDSPEIVRLDAIREFAAEAPMLEAVVGPSAPKYQVIRLNERPQQYDGHRYSVVRLKLPPGDPYTIGILFTDVGNIVEYEIMPAQRGLMPLRGNTRFIHPAIVDHDHEKEAELTDLTLPKPWDHFELHLLGFPLDSLKSGEEYLIWFRFADKQPADVCLAAILVRGSVDIAPEKLPSIFNLPEDKHE